MASSETLTWVMLVAAVVAAVTNVTAMRLALPDTFAANAFRTLVAAAYVGVHGARLGGLSDEAWAVGMSATHIAGLLLVYIYPGAKSIRIRRRLDDTVTAIREESTP